MCGQAYVVGVSLDRQERTGVLVKFMEVSTLVGCGRFPRIKEMYTSYKYTPTVRSITMYIIYYCVTGALVVGTTAVPSKNTARSVHHPTYTCFCSIKKLRNVAEFEHHLL